MKEDFSGLQVQTQWSDPARMQPEEYKESAIWAVLAGASGATAFWFLMWCLFLAPVT